MISILNSISGWLQPYLPEISLTIIATLLVIYGDVINKHIKRALSPYHFLIRTGLFVIICAFGYGAFIVFLTPHLQAGLEAIPITYRGISIVSVFLLMGYLAENRRYI